MELKLYNTMTGHKEVFEPINPGEVGLYVCGVESFDINDLDHARAVVSYDVLHRYLKHLGYKVNYVRLFRDLGPKITKLANESGESESELSDRLYKEYLAEMEALQCLPPTVDPRVSQHMNQIIDMIQKIIDQGCGYVVGDSVFFSIGKSPNYGKFPATQTRAKDPKKPKPADFELWMAAKPGELSWDSPWGKGRPGWYIACSAISAHYLSPTFDIHGGATELEFPHHENELAQTCAACEEGGGGVNYWLHNKTARSKKLPEKTIRETLQGLSEALVPYREAMSEDSGKSEQTAEAKDIISKLKSEFEGKMLDDLNTAHILTGAYQDALKFINASIGKLKGMQEEEQRLSLLVSLVEIEKAAREVLDVLGLLTTVSYAEILKEMREINEARENAMLEREVDELRKLKKQGACLHFIDSFRPTFYKEHPRPENTFTGGEMLVASGDKWRKMTPEDKLSYEILAEKDFSSVFEEYKQELLAKAEKDHTWDERDLKLTLERIKNEPPFTRLRDVEIKSIMGAAKKRKIEADEELKKDKERE